MGGGAWSFLVGGAICLVNSVNERDLSLLTSYAEVCDALRCSGPHARYTDVFNESIALADRPGGRRSRNKVSVGEPAEGSLSKPAPAERPANPWHDKLGSGGTRPSRAVEGRVRARHGSPTNPGARSAKEMEYQEHALVASVSGERLSATDISALASMKNVAKCDTWCELQNPVNHRVFERKLRPRPPGRGHVCLGVAHRRPRSPRLTRAGADTGLPRAPARGWPKIESPATGATTSGG
ncbi:hypothetical protein SADUNF_Sadunf18G0044900 [Salix dunnii]|uniref:Uncharacterized protein n=1 Tax=Salix dunnii TaxID=1413687 RepID=A0A835J4A1_9ROSI|nr:hypothetical protein SADUNF_Sadunf18G0044900 [Salix dunnii]